MPECKHPLYRRFAWVARDDSIISKRKKLGVGQGRIMCIACCDCGEVLQGGVDLDEILTGADPSEAAALEKLNDLHTSP